MSSPEAVVFPGLKEVVELVDTLCRRPRFGDDPPEANNPRRDRRASRGQPIICLISPDQDTGLRQLAERLNNAGPRPVPHCLVKPDSATGDLTEVGLVRDILAKAAAELGNSRNASGGRIRFRRFGLLNWLMKQPSDPNQSAEQRTTDLRQRLRKQDVTQRFDDVISSSGENISLPGWLNNLRALVKAIPPLLFRLRLSGRFPLIGRQYRWFLRQPHLTPEVPGGFLGFAERLTDAPDGWRAENAVQLSRLLTNAFLEDLRRAWRSPWRFGGSRRMTYPVMLLENITSDNGGHQVLRLINHVRTEAGLFDPLLVISTSRRVPPGDQPSGDLSTYDDLPGERYRTWRRELPDRRRARDETAWYLYIPPSKRVDSKKTEHELEKLRPYQVSRPPWWGRRIVPVGAVLILLAGLAFGYVTWSKDHCGDGWQWPSAGSELTTVDDQCIGVTDGHYTFDPALADVTQRILAQNEQADAVYADDPTRIYVTMVDLQALSPPPGGTDGLAAEREGLEGVAVAQAQALSDPSGPLFRLLIGNAGTGMAYGTTVAAQLRNLPTGNAPLVGVVGLDHSTQATDDTVLALAIDGLPTVAASLSEDQLTNSNPLYYQVSPQNKREAAVAAVFAKTLVASGRIDNSVEVVHPDDPNDTYSRNLAQDVLTQFSQTGFRTTSVTFAPSATPPDQVKPGILYPLQIGKNACAFHGLVYYAGDGVPDFNAFLDGAKKCAAPPALLADDDVTRYVADTAAREQNQSMPFWYTSFATAPTSTPQGPASDFYGGPVGLYALFPQDRGKHEDPSLDGHAALSFDAAQTLLAAVSHLRIGNEPLPVTPGDVWRELSAIRSSEPNPRNPNPNNDDVLGVTGLIDFGTNAGNLHYPANKQISILLVQQGEVRSTALFCGAPDDRRQSPNCPIDQN